MKIIEDLYKLNHAPVSPDSDKAVARFCRELDFKVHEVRSGSEKNGWIVPNSWSVKKAEIRKDGELIYDGTSHPLGVVGYSPSYSGAVQLNELKEHLFFSSDYPEDLIYHCTHFFRPKERDWGFCIPKKLYDSLKPGSYEIEIQVDDKPSTMKILEFSLPGSSEEEVLFHAHTCHPGQANDDLSGCYVGIEVMKELLQRKERKFTYTLILSPELYGSFYWLDSLSEERVSSLKFGVMLKAVGNKEPLKLQKSFTGLTELDVAASNIMRGINQNFESYPFKRLYGNDETIFEAPGYEIPSISLTRFPFPEYHTSRDTPDRVSIENLSETKAVALGIVDVLEKNVRLKRRFKGLIALSNPKYDLYQKFWNPADPTGPGKGSENKWFYLMTEVFRDMEGNVSILEIAERYKLPFSQVFDYLTKWKQRDLVEFV